jgi:hypothetical protein
LSTQPDWTFTGTITERVDKTYNSKNLQELLIVRAGDKYGDSVCACTHWGDMPPQACVGATVTAEGWIKDRKGKDRDGKDRYWPGHTASRVYVQGHESPATPADKPAAPASEQPSGGDQDLPF